MRVFVFSALFGIGYLLIYAAVQDGGAHALRPWEAFQD